MTLHDGLGKQFESMQFVPKGWGYEKILVNNEVYCGKLLHMVCGRKMSVHYHKEKHETFYLHKGEVDLFYHDNIELIEDAVKNDKKGNFFSVYDIMERVTLTQGSIFPMPVGRIHQVRANQDSELFEFSTHDDPNDSYRLIKGD